MGLLSDGFRGTRRASVLSQLPKLIDSNQKLVSPDYSGYLT